MLVRPLLCVHKAHWLSELVIDALNTSHIWYSYLYSYQPINQHFNSLYQNVIIRVTISQKNNFLYIGNLLKCTKSTIFSSGVFVEQVIRSIKSLKNLFGSIKSKIVLGVKIFPRFFSTHVLVIVSSMTTKILHLLRENISSNIVWKTSTMFAHLSCHGALFYNTKQNDNQGLQF